MPRPKSERPTPGELEVLNILWQRGPLTVREVLEVLNQSRRRAYTSVMSLLNVMTDKGLLKRRPQGRAFVYQAKVAQDKTLGQMIEDLLGRAFGGSASALVAHLLDRSNPTPAELEKIRRTIDEHLKQ
jgi:BlaI family penicillinase repressor